MDLIIDFYDNENGDFKCTKKYHFDDIKCRATQYQAKRFGLDLWKILLEDSSIGCTIRRGHINRQLSLNLDLF